MWTLLLPELIVILTGFGVLSLDFTFLKGEKRWLMSVALAGIVLAGFLAVYILSGMSAAPAELFGGRLVVDSLGMWFKITFLLATFITLSSGMETLDHSTRGEFLSVILFTLSGMMLLISCQDIVSLYVSLELATVPLFALTAWSRTERSGEAGLKYLAIGILASAFLLYGLGFLFGLSGETSLAGIAAGLSPSPALWLAIGLCVAGVGFKLTLFPFHFWAPDAYEGAPTPVTAYLSVASKAAGLVVAFQLFYRIFGAFLPELANGVAIFAAATMTLGNLVAILQKNLKRFMAYSAISQAGYVILGFLGRSGEDAASMVFYMMVYVLTNLAAFAILIAHLHQRGEREGEGIEGLRGLSQTNPGLALAMMVALFGLAGIPPLAGFVGKFFLFSVAAKQGFYWLVAVAALNSTVSLYYYLRIVRQMYIEKPREGVRPLAVSPMFAGGLGLATAGSVICGLVPFFYERIGIDATHWLALLSP